MIEQATLFNHAKALYRQREGCLLQNRVDMTRLLNLEARLREQLFALSRFKPFADDEPADASDAFVYIAVRLIQSDKELQLNAAHYACDLLLEPDSKAEAAKNALLLFPSKATLSSMKQVYAENEMLRPILIHILTHQSVRLPEQILKSATLSDQDPFLQSQVLYYAANDPESPLEQFQEYYLPLLAHRDTDIEHEVLLAAIWGGMVRHDEDALVALRRAIEIESDDLQRLDFLRLAALTGDPEYFPMLANLVEHVPAIAFHFLALHGSQESVSEIYQGLLHPRTAEHAEDPWWLVTGQALPKIPRMSVVGEENSDSEREEEIGFMPDSQSAEQWWLQHTTKPVARWLQGKPFSIVQMQLFLKHYTGLISNDVLDMLALNLQKPMQVGHFNWQALRLKYLTEAMSSPAALEVKPLEAQGA